LFGKNRDGGRFQMAKRSTKAVLTSLAGSGDADALTGEAIADVVREVFSFGFSLEEAGILSRRKVEVAINFATVEAEIQDLAVLVVGG
jgi:hypothetical protein